MVTASVLAICSVAAGMMAMMLAQCRLSAACRTTLRPHAERLIIEKRWMERAARSNADYRRQWDRQLWALYLDHVSRWGQRIFDLPAFERALDAEFAGLLNQEIASWTFIDRASTSPASFERIVARCLEHDGWIVRTPKGAGQLDLHMVLTRDARRIGVRCHYGPGSPECLAVYDCAFGGRRMGCDAVYLVSNGSFSGPVTVFAKDQNVTLLHCSQLEQIASRDGPARANAAFDEDERLAA